MRQNLRRSANLAPHAFYTGAPGEGAPDQITNVVHRASRDEDAWIEEATGQIGEWRSLSRSTYLRWAITINACEVAEARYAARPETRLSTETLRCVNGVPECVTLALWPGPEASEHYKTTKTLIAAYGVGDLYGALEDILFEFAEIFYRHHPLELLQGSEPEMRKIRRQFHHRNDDDASRLAWDSVWASRFEKWRHKKVYDGLPRLLRGVFTAAGLRRPSSYKHTDVNCWAETLEMVALLRHHIVHGVPTVSPKLAALSNRATSLTFDFVEGATLEVRLHHLQSVECFIDQLLGAFNISLVEKAVGSY